MKEIIDEIFEAKRTIRWLEGHLSDITGSGVSHSNTTLSIREDSKERWYLHSSSADIFCNMEIDFIKSEIAENKDKIKVLTREYLQSPSNLPHFLS